MMPARIPAAARIPFITVFSTLGTPSRLNSDCPQNKNPVNIAITAVGRLCSGSSDTGAGLRAVSAYSSRQPTIRAIKTIAVVK